MKAHLAFKTASYRSSRARESTKTTGSPRHAEHLLFSAPQLRDFIICWDLSAKYLTRIIIAMILSNKITNNQRIKRKTMENHGKPPPNNKRRVSCFFYWFAGFPWFFVGWPIFFSPMFFRRSCWSWFTVVPNHDFDAFVLKIHETCWSVANFGKHSGKPLSPFYAVLVSAFAVILWFSTSLTSFRPPLYWLFCIRSDLEFACSWNKCISQAQSYLYIATQETWAS